MTNQQYFERLHDELCTIYASILFTPREAYELYDRAVFRAYTENLITHIQCSTLELLNERFYKAYTGNNPYTEFDRV